MADAEEQARADALFEEAIEEGGARDPREYYRDRLRDLKKERPSAYAEAVRYYEETLVPAILGGDDPVEAWQLYGRKIAELTAQGTTVEIDGEGRRHPYGSPAGGDRLVLHLPEARNLPALLVSLPAEPSPAQRATFDLLVRRKTRLSG